MLDIGCGWGGLGLYLAECRRRRRDRRHALAGAARDRQRARGGKGPGRTASRSSLQDYRDVSEPFDRIVSVGMFEHVGVNHLRHVLPQERAAARRRRRDGAALDRPLGRTERHQSVDREIYLPRRLHPVAVGGAAGHRAIPACWSPTSRSCACTMPRRSSTGASASSRIARRSSASTTSASCACGSSIWRRRKCRSASRT